jgi:hypothetical protein
MRKAAAIICGAKMTSLPVWVLFCNLVCEFEVTSGVALFGTFALGALGACWTNTLAAC